MELQKTTFVFVVILLFAGVTSVRAAILCYCNSPECAARGYVCTSHLGKCFSQFGYSGEAPPDRLGAENLGAEHLGAEHLGTEHLGAEPSSAAAGGSSHGCVEGLPEEDVEVCRASGDIVKAKSPPSPWPVLMCCREEMCNYVDSLDVDILVNTHNLTEAGDRAEEGRLPAAPRPPAPHLWFQAAVIAVPIIGVLILVLLVLLAVRMLRADSYDRSVASHSLAKAQLYAAPPPPPPHSPYYDSEVGVYHSYYQPQCYHDCAQLKTDFGGYEKIGDFSSDCSESSGPPSSVVVEDRTSNEGPGTIV